MLLSRQLAGKLENDFVTPVAKNIGSQYCLPKWRKCSSDGQDVTNVESTTIPPPPAILPIDGRVFLHLGLKILFIFRSYSKLLLQSPSRSSVCGRVPKVVSTFLLNLPPVEEVRRRTSTLRIRPTADRSLRTQAKKHFNQ